MDSELVEHVRYTALELVRDFEQGERESDNWRDEEASYRVVHSAMQNCLSRLEEIRCYGEANRLPSSEFWRVAGERLRAGSLLYHARTKPRGYAGDFEMLARIWDGYRCQAPLGRELDRYFQEQPAPQAVRNRTEIVATSIIDVCRRSSGTCRIVSVGSGPAVDVQRALEKLTKAEQARLHITLVDIDPAALDHARERLTPHVSEEQLQLVRENLYRFHHGPRAAESLNGADLIFCTGLFDYLDEAAATDMLATFWNRLAASGLLLVFNFSAQNPSRTFMEWIGNWYLIYRDKNQMAELAARAGMTTSQFKIDAESLGIDLFIRADKQ